MGLVIEDTEVGIIKKRALMRPEAANLTVAGTHVSAMPENQATVLDFTTNIGGCSGLYYSMIFQLPKWGYWLKKVEESMDVSPVYAEAYNLTIEQKHKLEGQIKQGLSSAAQAVADYELIRHDYRKYREILDLLKEGQKDDHVLRALFIDRVDVHVGEPFSMVSMVKRWPTIIADFIRLPKVVKEGEDADVEKVRQALKITSAEAHVLKTKNELYKKWKEKFRPEVTERYARVKNLMQTREKSVDYYREWLKPYVAKYKMLEEMTQESPSKFYTDPYMAPAFGNAWASSSIRFFAWRPFYSPEVGKAQRQEPRKANKIYPIDDLVLKYAEKIADVYGIWKKELEKGQKEGKTKKAVLEEQVEKILKDALETDPIDKTKTPAMSKSSLYYILFDIKADKTLIKIPKGGELENITLKIKHFLLSQNVLLIILIELKAKELQFERYVKEMIGSSEAEKEIREEVEKEFEEKGGEKSEGIGGIKKFVSFVKKKWGWVTGKLSPYKLYFFRPGPYESNFQERVTQQYMIPMAAGYLKPFIQFLKWKGGVPGMPEEY